MTLGTAAQYWPVIVSVVLTMSFVAAPYVAADIGDGLVVHLPFDGSYDDASGNANHGTSHGATLVEDRSGNPSSAVLVGASAWVEVADDDSLDLTSELSVAAWVRVEGEYSTWNVIVGKDYNVAYSFGFWSANVDCEPSELRRLDLSVGYSFELFSDGTLDCGTWTHVAVTFDDAADRAILYIDGHPVQEVVQTGFPGNSDSSLGIGRDGRWGDYLIGALDDVRLYDRVLTAEEVATLAAGVLFADGFESGGLDAWGASAP